MGGWAVFRKVHSLFLLWVCAALLFDAGAGWATDVTETIPGTNTFSVASEYLGGIESCWILVGDHSYSAKPLVVSQTNTYTFTVTNGTGDFHDPFMAIYSPTFNADDPEENLVACNDDSIGLYPSLSASIAAGQSYVVVITTWNEDASASGTVEYTITPDVTLLEPGNGTCGSADGTNVTSAPGVDQLCDFGAPSLVTDEGTHYTWTCYGVGGGVSDADCSANKQADGVCGASDGGTFAAAPSTNLCSDGIPSALTGTGPWNWTCQSENGGSNANCSADIQVNGACGESDGGTFSVVPSTNLCSDGIPSALTGTGPWNWTCQSENGGSNANCSADIQVNGACGESDGGTFSVVPSTNLCSDGIPSALTGTGPWNWTCQSGNGGSNANCSAGKETPQSDEFALKVLVMDFCDGTVPGGEVTGDSGSIDCGPDCEETYTGTTMISLNASPLGGYGFMGWDGTGSGIYCGMSPQCSFRLGGSASLTAWFSRLISSPSMEIFNKFPARYSPSCDEPMGVGMGYKGTRFVDLSVKLPGFENPTDLYLGIYAPDADAENLYLVTESGELKPWSVAGTDELSPWKRNVTQAFHEWPFGRQWAEGVMPGIFVPSGRYEFYLLTVTSGADLSQGYYLWKTTMTAQ